MRGLTTAAGVWTTAGVGLAAGGGDRDRHPAGTVAYLLISVGYPYVSRYLPAVRQISPLRVTYQDGAGVLRRLVAECAEHGFAIANADA